MAGVYTATVESNKDFRKSGFLELRVFLEDKSIVVDAEYASPLAGDGYGFIALPKPGTTVLVTYAGDNSNTTIDESRWICFANVYTGEEENFGPDPTKGTQQGESVYGGDWDIEPSKYMWRTPSGHSLTFAERAGVYIDSIEQKLRSSDKQGGGRDVSVTLASKDGKKLVLDDTLGGSGDKIVLEDEDGNGIRIQTGNDNPPGVGSIKIEAKQNCEIIGNAGQILIQRTNANPANAANIEIQNIGPGKIIVNSNGGEVEVVSNKKVTIVAQNLLNPLIGSQVEVTPEKVSVRSNTIVELHSALDLNLTANKTINIQAPEVNIDAINTSNPTLVVPDLYPPKGII